MRAVYSPAEAEGTIERKQEYQIGHLKAPVRTWKKFYMVLTGHLLSFYRDHDGALALKCVQLFLRY
jgi:hypothetical protein